MSNRVIAARVGRGAKWLDKHYPLWWKKIKVSKLVMSNQLYCVCGQLDSIGMYTFVDRHKLAERTQVSLGFWSSDRFDTSQLDEYSLLGDEWRRVIRERRKQVKHG